MKITLTTMRAATLGVAISALAPMSAHAAGKLSLYNWFDYMPQALLDKFSAEHDVVVTVDTYESNEALLAKLKSGVRGYDLAVPGDYMVQIMIAEGLLEKIDANQLPNFGNVSEQWRDVSFDPGRQYSIPYQWGTTSFMVDTAVYDGEIDTLGMLFDAPDELKGKINMLKDVNDVINMGLRYLGHDMCNSNRAQLKEVNDLLVKAKQDFLSFNSDGARESLVSGDAAAGMIWNGMGMRARDERTTLKYAYPKEGMTAWMDNLVVVKDAPNLENAKKFMNFMLEPENAAALTNFTRYTDGVDGTEEFLEPALAAAPELNVPADAPPPQFVPPCEPDVVKLYDRIWTNLLK